MATLEQQAAQEFREHLQSAWDRQRAIEQTILSFVDTPRKGVKAYLEAVQDAATEVTRDQVRINYGNLEFDTNKESVSQRYTFSSPTVHYSIDLTFYAHDVFYNARPYPAHDLRGLFQALSSDLIDVFKLQ